jgi:hypothetical protein
VGKKTPKAPTPVDPGVVSGAQAKANIDSATAQQRLNMVNTSGPLGATSYAADASAPGGYRQTTTLDPKIQGLVDNLSGRIGQGIDFSGIPGYQFQVNPNHEVSDAMYAQATSRLDPRYAQEENALRTRLANQGLTPGSAAYDRAFGNFSRERNDAYNLANFSAIQGGEAAGLSRAQLANSATGSARGDELSRYGAEAGNLQGLFSLAQGGTPSMGYAGVAPTDVTGAYGLNAQMANNAYQAQMQNQQSTLGGLFSLGSAAISAWNPLAGIAVKAATSGVK